MSFKLTIGKLGIAGCDLYTNEAILHIDTDNEELNRALKVNVECIGINNRNLKTLEINPETFNILSKEIPDNIIKICESGINNNKQLYEYSKNGADAFLIGETLMKSENIEIATKNLIKK